MKTFNSPLTAGVIVLFLFWVWLTCYTGIYLTPSTVIGFTLGWEIGEYAFPFINIALEGGDEDLRVLKVDL